MGWRQRGARAKAPPDLRRSQSVIGSSGLSGTISRIKQAELAADYFICEEVDPRHPASERLSIGGQQGDQQSATQRCVMPDEVDREAETQLALRCQGATSRCWGIVVS